MNPGKHTILKDQDIQPQMRIDSDCTIIDDGSIQHVAIDIIANTRVNYCFVPRSSGVYHRHIRLSQGVQFVGTSICMDDTSAEIITEVRGDTVSSQLDILGLSTTDSRINLEGVARVLAPYREISTRVDQTNILIGDAMQVMGVPRLEISTDDIVGGHSCRIHRLGGEALFYLTARGLSHTHAEALLMNSEILKHLRTLPEDTREIICREVHMRLLGEKTPNRN